MTEKCEIQDGFCKQHEHYEEVCETIQKAVNIINKEMKKHRNETKYKGIRIHDKVTLELIQIILFNVKQKIQEL